MQEMAAKPRTCGLASEERVILRALSILRRRFQERDVFSSPDAVKDYLRLQAQGLSHEVFAVMYLDARNRFIEYERLFRGTLTQTSVYPREVVKQALTINAASVVLHHNHPSGVCEPSRSDEALTHTLKASLALVDVRVLDHVITSTTARCRWLSAVCCDGAAGLPGLKLRAQRCERLLTG